MSQRVKTSRAMRAPSSWPSWCASVDSTTGVSESGAALHSVCSLEHNEFYLNSHLAVLGTSKPCKYSLIYDEIGLKVLYAMCDCV